MVLQPPTSALSKFCDFELKDRLPPRGRRKRKHVPHRLRSKEFVRRRNNRERRRVQGINTAFEQLRQRVPHVCRDDRASKISILRLASSYIRALTSLLYDLEDAAPQLAQQAGTPSPFPTTMVTEAVTCSSSPLPPPEDFVAESDFTNRILKGPCMSSENKSGLSAEDPNVLSLLNRQNLTNSPSVDAACFILNLPAAAKAVTGLRNHGDKQPSSSAKLQMMPPESTQPPCGKSALSCQVMMREFPRGQPDLKNLCPSALEENAVCPPFFFGFGSRMEGSQVTACGGTLSFVTARSSACSLAWRYRSLDVVDVANSDRGQVNLQANAAVLTTKCKAFQPSRCQFQCMSKKTRTSGVTPPQGVENDFWQETVPQTLTERSRACCSLDGFHPDLVALETCRQDNSLTVLKCACAECRHYQNGCMCLIASEGAERLQWLAGEPWQALSAV